MTMGESTPEGDGGACEALLLGRRPLDGGVNAATLATLVKIIRSRVQSTGTRLMLRCGATGLEASYAADEGFESDVGDDESGCEEQCCDNAAKVIRDHVFRDDSSSANSSASSDTDEIDAHLASSTSTTRALTTGIHFSLTEVVFCHTDAEFPRVVVWVVKSATPSPSSTPPQSNDSSRNEPPLEALVFECDSESSSQKLCEQYHEARKRERLDRYAIQRRKPMQQSTNKSLSQSAPSIPAAVVTSTSISQQQQQQQHPKVVNSDNISQSSAIYATPNNLNKDIANHIRWNLVQVTDGDGVTHIAVSGTTPSSQSSSVGEQPQTTAGNDKPRTKLSKEIEGVILATEDARREPMVRQRQPARFLPKQTPPPPLPPQRPERRRYVNRKKPSAPQTPQQQSTTSTSTSKSHEYQPTTKSSSSNTSSAVSRGQQYLRVSVDQLQSAAGLSRLPQVGWVYVSLPTGSDYASLSSTGATAALTLAPPTLYSHWLPTSSSSRNRDSKLSQQEMKRRSRSKSPPRRPMAYRYIDVSTPLTQAPPHPRSSSSSRPRESRRSGGGSSNNKYAAPLSVSTHHFEPNNGPRSLPFSDISSSHTSQNINLKPVIKKTRKYGESAEPKKVTFSAFATVQVVD